MTQVDTVSTLDEGNTKLRQRARKYCFTLNNYTQNNIDTIILYVTTQNGQYIIGKEVGESGTPHLQGYIEFKNAISFNSLKKIMPQAHIEKTRGNKTENLNYCKKDNDYLTNIIEKKKYLCQKL